MIPTCERRKRKKPKQGRPLRTDATYRQRWKVERYFGWMDNCRRLVVRYERHLHIYRAVCLVAIILRCEEVPIFVLIKAFVLLTQR
jgi:transposase